MMKKFLHSEILVAFYLSVIHINMCVKHPGVGNTSTLKLSF